jgi:uncharacterized membrane protein
MDHEFGLAGCADICHRTVVAAVGALAGAFGGYRARVGLVRSLEVKDVFVAIPEDVLAIGLGLLVVSRF